MANIEIYVDDIVIMADSNDLFAQMLHRILSVLTLAGVRANAAKCELFKAELEILGHSVGYRSIRPGRNHLESFLALARPQVPDISQQAPRPVETTHHVDSGSNEPAEPHAAADEAELAVLVETPRLSERHRNVSSRGRRRRAPTWRTRDQ